MRFAVVVACAVVAAGCQNRTGAFFNSSPLTATEREVSSERARGMEAGWAFGVAEKCGTATDRVQQIRNQLLSGRPEDDTFRIGFDFGQGNGRGIQKPDATQCSEANAKFATLAGLPAPQAPRTAARTEKPPAAGPQPAPPDLRRMTRGERAAYAAGQRSVQTTSATAASAAPPAPSRPDRRSLVDSALAQQLVDPDSRRVEFLRENEQLVCGTVNARNRMGGYAGAEPFVAGFSGDTLVGVAIVPWREARTYGGWLLRGTDKAAALRTCGFIE